MIVDGRKNLRNVVGEDAIRIEVRHPPTKSTIEPTPNTNPRA